MAKEFKINNWHISLTVLCTYSISSSCSKPLYLINCSNPFLGLKRMSNERPNGFN